MREKNYTQQEAFRHSERIAAAEAIGQMGANGGGGMVGDLVTLGVGITAAGQVGSQMGDMLKNLNYTPAAETVSKAETTEKCSTCGAEVPANAKFCLECGTKIEHLAEHEMICPECGKKTAKGKFCMECGAALVRKCGKCGTEIHSGAKFCLECGEKL